MRARPVALLAVPALVVLTACGGGGTTSSSTGLAGLPPEVHVIAATVTPSGEGTAVVAFAAHNAGSATDRLTGVTCECGGSATILQGGSTAVDGIDIAPDENHIFEPGGDVVNLQGLTAPLTSGTYVGLTLTFQNAGDVQTDAKVTKPKP